MGYNAMRELKASLLDDDAFRLLAFPFTGPIPHPRNVRGVDLDAEWFDERTDIKPDWLKARPVDWHHGKDPLGIMGYSNVGDDMPAPLEGRAVIGKAIEPEMDEHGWWVKVWLQAGDTRVRLIKALQDRGAQLFGSSETIGELARVDKASGHIELWPYWRQTLSTSPQNTHSVLRPLKASLADAMRDASYTPSDAFWADLTAELSDLQTDLRDGGAKAGPTDGAGDEWRAMETALGRLTPLADRLLHLVKRTSQE